MDDTTLLDVVQALAHDVIASIVSSPPEAFLKSRAFGQHFFPQNSPEVRFIRHPTGSIAAEVLPLGGVWTSAPPISDPDPRLITARVCRSGTVVLRAGAFLARPALEAPSLNRIIKRFPKIGAVGTFDLLLPELPESAHARLVLKSETMHALAQEIGLRPGRILEHPRLSTPWIQASMPHLHVVLGLRDGFLSRPLLGSFSPPSLAFSTPPKDAPHG